MYKKQFLFCIVLLLTFYSHSQSFSSQIISSQGSIDGNEEITLEWTLGEAFTETIFSNDEIYTQGFHQPILFKNEVSLNLDFLEIRLYPNPIVQKFKIMVGSDVQEKLGITLLDPYGKFIKSFPPSTDYKSKYFDISELSSGFYLLNVSKSSGDILKTFKIIKN